MTLRFSAEQIIGMIKEYEAGVKAHGLCRFGYRRLGILLVREGFEVNHKKLFRLYREEG